jgi:hypothetical protein
VITAMSRVVEIRKAIKGALEAAQLNVYFQEAPPDAAYPYLVFDLPNSADDGTLEQFIMDLDGWDRQRDTTALENMMNGADLALNGKSFSAGGLSFTLYRDNRMSVMDPDPSLKRRKYIYQIRAYEGGEI